ncbi:MAG: hypothetical protein AAGC81_01770 [Pseudomonadota bacterium]
MTDLVKSLLVLLLLNWFSTDSVLAAEDEGPLRIVSLLQTDSIERLENLNRLDALCGSPATDPTCIQQNLSPTTQAIAIYAGAADPKPFGFFVITYTPGVGPSASYLMLENGGRSLFPFEPDIYDSDWGYGPFFHQTLLRQTDDWYEIALPGPGRPTGWIKLENATVAAFSNGELVRMTETNEVRMILKVTEHQVVMRPFQPADMWCEVGTPPPLEDVSPITMPIDALYDARKRLLITYAYTRGC